MSARESSDPRAGGAVALREATEADLPALAQIYAGAVRALGPARYTSGQVASWAAFAGEEGFRAFVLEAHTLVAEEDGRAVGFAGLAADGKVLSLYVASGHGRRGIATTLLEALLGRARAEGMGRLHTAASEFSRPVFERAGFRVEEVERVERRGAVFERFLMGRDMDGPPGAPPA